MFYQTQSACRPPISPPGDIGGGMVPSAAACHYLQRVHSIPSLPGGDGSAQCIFVPGDL